MATTREAAERDKTCEMQTPAFRTLAGKYGLLTMLIFSCGTLLLRSFPNTIYTVQRLPLAVTSTFHEAAPETVELPPDQEGPSLMGNPRLADIQNKTLGACSFRNECMLDLLTSASVSENLRLVYAPAP